RMRQIRTSGSEGGETALKAVFPTPILFSFGAVSAAGNALGGGRISCMFMFGAAPLAGRAGGKYFPTCSAVPGTMQGVWVKAVGARFLAKAVTAMSVLAAASIRRNPVREAALSHFHRLDENSPGVAAFLKWVGGGATAWYSHQGVRRLRAVCKAGFALHGRGGQR
ncbi:MAG: hypothetical protein ACP5O1_08860, partial [Phycisphaerae bacterium]